MAPSCEYSPRHPRDTLLHQIISEELETFLVSQQERDRPVPFFVEQEFRSFLDCGLLERGFLRLRCESCGHDRLVPFSCKRRVWCPSCAGRRMSGANASPIGRGHQGMADTAAHLVDRVFPVVPVRQWVLSLPFALRYRMAYDTRLTSGVLNVFIRALFGELRRRAHRLLSLRRSQCGAVTFVQRFGDALNANVHFHCLALDGVYAAREDGRPEFQQLPAPEQEEVVGLTALVSQRVQSFLERRGIGTATDADEADPLLHDDPGLSALLASSVRRKIAVGSNSGHGVVRLGDQIGGDSVDGFEDPRCAMVGGFSVHANVCIEARDRIRLERLCRYAARPAVATERLTALPDGRLLYRLKRPWRDGTSAVIFERQDFIAKLAVLVPAPRAHLTRYHGVLAPASTWRPLIIPAVEENIREITSDRQRPSQPSQPIGEVKPAPCAPQRNYTWAQLMKRVFLIDVLQCENCGGQMKILAAIDQPDVIGKILQSLGVPSRAPPSAAVSISTN